jgi:PAS domain S-box-containing protein
LLVHRKINEEMGNKFQNINAKLVLLESLVVVTGLFVALYTFSKIVEVKENFELLNNVNTLKINFANQDLEISNLLEADQFNVSLYKNEKTNSVDAFNSFNLQDSIIIRDLITREDINTHSTLYDRCLKIEDIHQQYTRKYQILLINLKDRGFQNYGKAGEVYLLNNNITETLGMVNDYSLNQILGNLNDEVTAFTKTFNKDHVSNIYETSNQIVSVLYEMGESFPDLDINLTSQQLDLLNQKIEIVTEKNTDIGWENNAGILRELSSLSAELTGNLLDITDILNTTVPSRNKQATQWVLIVIIIITLVLALYIIHIIRSFNVPIAKIKEYLSKFVQGALPANIDISASNEFKEIGHYLENVVDGLKEKTIFATELGKGNLNSEYASISDKDTLGNALLTLQKSLQKAEEEDKNHQVENERRRWTNEGLAKFSEILRMNNDNTEMLCDSVIKNLVKYLNASLGGIYLIKDEDKEHAHLYLASAFAYDRKKFVNEKILLGEGLIGACAQEKQTIYMTDIPGDYVKITSGLGDANPKVLLIVPLNLENEILGVLEISSFEPFEKHVLEFVEKLAESIASTLASAKINERTQHLLEQSQKQAVEMAEQEEEMRQNMEELQATQEESSRRESEMFGILHAINSTAYFFETDMDGVVTEINDRMLFILEMQREHVTGMHHSELTAMNKNSPEYISFWDDLKIGNSATKIQKYESASGNEVWLKQNYTPIFNKEGKAIKVVCISSDISETVQLEKNIQKLDRELSGKNNELAYLNTAIDMTYMKADLANDGTILDVGSNLEKTLVYAKKELLTKKIHDLIAPDSAKSFERIWENVINGHSFSNIIKFNTSAQEARLVKSSLKPIMKEKGGIVKIIFIGEVYSSNIDQE